MYFAVTPQTIPMDTIISNTEATACRLDLQTAKKLGSQVTCVLQKARPPKWNLPVHLQEAARALREDRTIVILPADKENSTVILYRSEYELKLEDMLLDGTYKKLKRDPASKVERELGCCSTEGSRGERWNVQREDTLSHSTCLHRTPVLWSTVSA